MRAALILASVLFIGAMLFLPLVQVFANALSKGFGPALAALQEPDALAAIRLTLITAVVAVPTNVGIGLCASWAIAKHRFPGKSLLITLIDLPFSVSPVVAVSPTSCSSGCRAGSAVG